MEFVKKLQGTEEEADAIMTTFEEWEAKYKPITNPYRAEEDVNDTFETYGEELEYVLKKRKENPKTIWTLIDGDSGELIISAGYHFVNRLNYFITEKEWESEFMEVKYCDEDENSEEEAACRA